MAHYEYIVVPAPRKGVSAKGIKGVPGKFANALTLLMNEMAAEGWDYQRTDTLPCEERQGLTGKAVKYHAMLVFRRTVEEELEDAPLAIAPPEEEEIEEEISSQDEASEPEEPVDHEVESDDADEEETRKDT